VLVDDIEHTLISAVSTIHFTLPVENEFLKIQCHCFRDTKYLVSCETFTFISSQVRKNDHGVPAGKYYRSKVRDINLFVCGIP
jgi:hypothetical protein